MNETVAKYLSALDRTNNNELLFTDAEKEEFSSFFKEHPELEQMRKELLEQKVSEFREQIANSYLAGISQYKDIEGQLKDLGFNIGGVKDVTLSSGKRMLVFFTEGSDTPTVIEYDKDKNILEELRQRQLDYKQYQGSNDNLNAEEMLKDIAKENNLYAGIVPIEKFEPSSKYFNDPEKMAIISSLLKQAEIKNAMLPLSEKFAFIDEENNIIVSRSGVVLEGKINTVTQEVDVNSPESKEFKNESINDETVGSIEQSIITGDRKEIEDQGYVDPTLATKVDSDVYENTVKEVLARYNYEVTDEQRQEIVDNLRKLSNKEITIEDLPESQREFYTQCILESQDLVSTETEIYKETTLDDDNKDFVRENTYTRTLRYVPKKDKKKNEEGSSNYIYVAITVLLIALAIFIYIMIR